MPMDVAFSRIVFPYRVQCTGHIGVGFLLFI